MAWFPSYTHRRMWLALIGVLAGYVFLFPSSAAANYSEPVQPSAAVGAQLRYVLFLIVVLILVLGVSLLAIHRWSCHFRRLFLRRPAPPTPADDVWAMHRLQEDPGEAPGLGSETESS